MIESVAIIKDTTVTTYTDGWAVEGPVASTDFCQLSQIDGTLYINPDAVVDLIKGKDDLFIFKMQSGKEEYGRYDLVRHIYPGMDELKFYAADGPTVSKLPAHMWEYVDDNLVLYKPCIKSMTVLAGGLLRYEVEDGAKVYKLIPENMAKSSEITSYRVADNRVVGVFLRKEELHIIPIGIDELAKYRALHREYRGMYMDLLSRTTEGLSQSRLTIPYTSVAGEVGNILVSSITCIDESEEEKLYAISLINDKMILTRDRFYISLLEKTCMLQRVANVWINKYNLKSINSSDGYTRYSFQNGLERILKTQTQSAPLPTELPYLNPRNAEYVTTSTVVKRVVFSHRTVELRGEVPNLVNWLSNNDDFIYCGTMYVNKSRICYIDSNVVYFDSPNKLELNEDEATTLLKQLGGNN